MKIKTLILPLVAIVSVFIACNSTPHQENTYFNSADTGVLNGGLKMVTIKTPKGEFKIWTKRIGNNPKIKLLLRFKPR
jgi:proline iminopeptidase